MWFAHFMMFRGNRFAAWVGLLAVVQNVISSLFNSHLFDFVPGWMYVMSVGIASGMVLREKQEIGESRGRQTALSPDNRR
jgi:hypothetical protein